MIRRPPRSTPFPTRRSSDLSSLSRVPPVWPSPRPDIIGTATPHAATSGASTSDTLSPTPPVECLSTRGVAHESNARDRKSTRLNSSHGYISYAVFCLKKKTARLHYDRELA